MGVPRENINASSQIQQVVWSDKQGKWRGPRGRTRELFHKSNEVNIKYVHSCIAQPWIGP
jgi:hypothetical protein